VSKLWLALLLCASAHAVTFGPAAPLTPAATSLPASSGLVTLNYQSNNAGKCTVSATGAGVTTSPTGVVCSTAQTCNQASSIAVSVNNQAPTPTQYSVQVACTDVDGVQGRGTVATVTAPAKGVIATCPAIKSSTSGIANFTRLTGKVTTVDSKARLVDVTSFVSVYNYPGQTLPWPSAGGIIAAINLPNANYLSEAFTIGAGVLPTNGIYDNYTIGQSWYTVPISMTISTTCGDFSPPTVAGSTVLPGCYVNKGTPGNNFFLQWTNTASCKLVNGGSYYFNVINADVSTVAPNGGGTAASTKSTKCTGSACTDPIQNGPGSW
jgi:hypothetical protein